MTFLPIKGSDLPLLEHILVEIISTLEYIAPPSSDAFHTMGYKTGDCGLKDV